MSLDSYNSQYPLAYYEVGTAYSFYCHNIGFIRLKEASADIIKRYSKELKEAIAENKGHVGGNGIYMAFTRAVGVVVEKKEKTNAENDVDKIVVMFEMADGKYIIDEFAVAACDVYTNEKEIVMPSAKIGIASTSSVEGMTVTTKKGNSGSKTKTGPAVVDGANTKTGPTVDTVTGPAVDTVTGPTVEVDTNTKTGPTIDKVSGATVEE